MSGNVSPLEPLPQSDDPEFHSFSEDLEQRFFEEAEQVKIEVTLMRETWDELSQVIEENDWKPNEGLIVLLTTGMAFLRSERALTVTSGAAGLSEAEIKKLLDRLAVIEARYASIKNFAFDVMRDHRTLEIRYAPLEREYLAFRNLVWPLRRENDALTAEVARLKLQLEAAGLATPAPAVAAPRSRWRRLVDSVRSHFNRV